MKTRGINHLAMVTNDMEKTVRFYRDVMGFPLVAAIGNNPNGLRARHYFFETGSNSTIAFFEWEGAEDFHKPAGLEAAGRIQFDHVSFDVETEDELLELQARLADAGQEVTTVIDHNFIHSIYFHDFSGIALEASVWITNPHRQGTRLLQQEMFSATPIQCPRSKKRWTKPAWSSPG